MPATKRPGAARPCISGTTLLTGFLLVVATNYVTFIASGGFSRVTRDAGPAPHAGVRSQQGVAAAPAAAAPVVAAAAAKGVRGTSAVPAAGGSYTPPKATTPLADFCTVPDELELSDTSAAAVAAGQWDAVGQWPLDRAATLLSFPCFQATLRNNELTFLPAYICTHDPVRDQVMADSFHKWGWWGANLDHRFMLAAGYSAGTPLRNLDSALLREAGARAAAAGTPYNSVADIVKALALAPVTAEQKVQAACSRERPLVLDVGANIGYYTIVAAAAGGCQVVSVEPLSANIGRLWQSVLANDFGQRVTLFKNAVGKDKRLVTLDLNPGNPGASVVSDSNVELDEEGKAPRDPELAAEAGRQETVATILLDELFDGAPHRPKHPFLGRPIQPGDIAFLKTDVEGFDAAALWALRGTIEAGRPPLIKVEYEPHAIRGRSGCDNVGLMRWLYGLGYAAYGFGQAKPFTLEQWETIIIPLILAGKADDVHEKHDLPVVRELYLVHEAAKVPAVIGADSKAGKSPV